MSEAEIRALSVGVAPPAAGLQRLRRVAAGAVVVGAAGCAAGAVLAPDQLLRSYLVGHLFWLGISLGALALAMLHHLTHGAWGVVIRRIFEAASDALPLLALLFLPVLAGMGRLYPWMRTGAEAADPLLAEKAKYLNAPFFLLRAGLFFAIWTVLAWMSSRWSAAQDRSGRPAYYHRLQALSAVGLLLFMLTASFASFDWLMSLEPHWFSSIYGAQFVGGALIAGFSFAILVTRFLVTSEPMSKIITPKLHQDHGTMLFTFLLLWGYFGVSQFLIIWSANLPEEIPYFLIRQAGGWQYMALGLVLLHFAVPFLLLLSPRIKRDPRTLSAVALLLLVMRWVDLYWQAAPNFSPRIGLHWLDVAAWLALGGVWLWFFARRLGGRSLLPVHDPFLPEALANG